jgi:uncharacterized protein
MARLAAYFDTTVLVKRYARESGSDRAVFLMRRNKVISAATAPLEMLSAVRRKLATAELETKAYNAILKRLELERGKWELVTLSPEILHTAEEIVCNHNMRTLDAIHLACATMTQSHLSDRLPFITSDSAQRDAALKLGLEVVWVQ